MILSMDLIQYSDGIGPTVFRFITDDNNTPPLIDYSFLPFSRMSLHDQINNVNNINDNNDNNDPLKDNTTRDDNKNAQTVLYKNGKKKFNYIKIYGNDRLKKLNELDEFKNKCVKRPMFTKKVKKNTVEYLFLTDKCVNFDYHVDLLNHNISENIIEIIMLNNYELFKFIFYSSNIKDKNLLIKMVEYSFYYVVRFCDIDIIKFLLSNIDIELNKKINGLYPIQGAILANDLEKVKFILPHCNVNNRLENGYSLLHVAIYLGNFEIIDILINNGAELNKKFHNKYPFEFANDVTYQYIQSKYECNICYEIANIARTYCGCTIKYCIICINKIKKNDNKCCVCNQLLDKSNVMSISEIIDKCPNKYKIKNIDLKQIEKDIELIIGQTHCSSLEEIINLYFKYEGDIVSTIMDLTM